jgi:hypothetical protein
MPITCRRRRRRRRGGGDKSQLNKNYDIFSFNK